jgi:AbrB family looped-hinge helix DNA binding protein
MPTATLTSKGQITLPKSIRDSLGLGRGDRIEFIDAANGTVVLRPIGRSVRELYGFLTPHNRASVSPQQLDDAMSEDLSAEDERIRDRRS